MLNFKCTIREVFVYPHHPHTLPSKRAIQIITNFLNVRIFIQQITLSLHSSISRFDVYAGFLQQLTRIDEFIAAQSR